MRKLAENKMILNRCHAESAIRMQQKLTIILLQRYVAFWLRAVFVLNGLSALAIIFLVGYGQMILSYKQRYDQFLVETVAQAAALFVIVTKHVFSCTRNLAKAKSKY